MPLLAYTLKMKTVSEESIRRKLGCVNFKIFYIRKHKPLVKTGNLLNFIQAKYFFFVFFCAIHRWREKTITFNLLSYEKCNL